MESIRRRVRLELLVAGLVLALAASLLVGWMQGRQISDLLDYQLEQTARSLVAHELQLRTDDLPDDPARHLVIRIAHGDELVYTSDDEVEVPFAKDTGFAFAQDRDQVYPGGLRVFTIHQEGVTVQVMQPRSLRRSLRLDGVLDALWPSLLTIVLLGLWAGHALRDALRPLDELRTRLALRDASSLAPIELRRSPVELQAPVQALNDLLGRLGRALDAQHRFTADAAHELRTPLAALRLQVENLGRAPDAAARTATLQALRQGIDRCSHLITQLLALARLDEQGALPGTFTPVDLRAVAQEALMAKAAQAQAAGVDLELLDGPAVTVEGLRDDLVRLVINLLDNAVKHSAPETTVTVTVAPGTDGHGPELDVADAGPGLTPEQRERVFDRFFRVDQDKPGSGLGLAICRGIAERHGATLSLEDRATGRGLRACLRFAPHPTAHP